MSEHTGETEERRSVVVSVRFSADEADRLRAAAERRGVAVSNLVRHAVLDDASAGLLRHRAVDGHNAGRTSIDAHYTPQFGAEVVVTGSMTDANPTYEMPGHSAHVGHTLT